MDLVEIVLILVAGVAAGTINAVVGSGTLVTFPTLVAFGYPPVIATMSNAVGQIPGGLSASFGYRRELQGQKGRILQLLPASLLGALLGSWLLLHLSPTVFEVVVPILLALALVLVVTQPTIQRAVRRHKEKAGQEQGTLSTPQTIGLIVAVFAVGVYGGYFTAAQGVLFVGIAGALLPDSLQRVNGLKNVLTLVVNVVAAAAYTIVAWDRISWAAAGLIAVGTLIGGFLGATVGRRLPAPVLRGVIVVLGVVAIWTLLAG